MDPKKPSFTPISDISPYSPFTLQATVISKVIGQKNKKWARLVLQDQSGEIQCNAFGDMIDSLLDKVEENQQYIIKGGKVNPKKSQFNHTSHDYEITFNSSTTITPTGQKVETKIFYNFSTLKQINERHSSFVDLIAVIREIEPVTTVTIKSSNESANKRAIKVCDDSNFSMDVTFWGDSATDFPGNIGDIIAIKSCTVKEFQGKTQISTTRSSHIEINPDQSRTQVLKEWYSKHEQDEFEEPTSEQKAERHTKTIYFSLIPDRHYGENQKFDYFNIYCYPIFISLNKSPYYLACSNPECRGKKLNDQMFCTKCEHQIDDPIPCFMFSCSFADFSGSLFASVINDNESGQAILGLTAQQLMEMNNENPEKDKFEEVLQSHLVQNALFKDLYLTIRIKTEEYDGNLKKKAYVVRALPVDYVQGAKFFFKEIQNYSQQ